MLRISDFQVFGIFVHIQCYILGMSPKSKHGIQLHFTHTLYTQLVHAHLTHITCFRFGFYAQPKVSFTRLRVACACHASSGGELELGISDLFICILEI